MMEYSIDRLIFFFLYETYDVSIQIGRIGMTDGALMREKEMAQNGRRVSSLAVMIE